MNKRRTLKKVIRMWLLHEDGLVKDPKLGLQGISSTNSAHPQNKIHRPSMIFIAAPESVAHKVKVKDSIWGFTRK